MLLSEAIRLGAMLAPQCFQKFYDKQTQATCALGAAAQALGIWGGLQFEQRYPWCLESSPVYCPHCGRKAPNPGHVIVHLNDDHRWSREAIAELVEALEFNRGIQDSEALSTQTDTQTSKFPIGTP